jgi:hypothetical protein
MKAIIYNTSGRILRSITAPREIMPLQCAMGESFLFGDAVDTDHYVSQGEILPRPVMPIQCDKTTVRADGVDSITLTGIPIGADITLGDQQTTALDPQIIITCDIQGKYELLIRLWPYLDYSGVVDAT